MRKQYRLHLSGLTRIATSCRRIRCGTTRKAQTLDRNDTTQSAANTDDPTARSHREVLWSRATRGARRPGHTGPPRGIGLTAKIRVIRLRSLPTMGVGPQPTPVHVADPALVSNAAQFCHHCTEWASSPADRRVPPLSFAQAIYCARTALITLVLPSPSLWH